MKNQDFVIVGIQPWDIGIGSNCKNIAIELSKYNRVLYINQPLDRITRIRKRNSPEIRKRLSIINGKDSGLVNISQNLWTYYPSIIVESINKLPHNKLYLRLNKRNNRLFAEDIQKAIQQLGFKNIILFNDSLIFLGFHLKEMLLPKKSIYYIRDNLITQNYFKKHGQIMEPALAVIYDIVVSNSVYLVQYLKPYNKHTFMVGQGCDFSLFNIDTVATEKPLELKNINSPIIGYVGFLTSMRLDIELIKHLAIKRPNYNFVLVGPEDEEFKFSILHAYKNVFFLGAKNESELPQYVNSFDVCINPQIINGMTVGNYPRKIDEYLALGKPTVATRTETMSFFSEHVYLSEGHDDFGNQLDIALANDSLENKEKRILFARSHTWENSVNKIFDAIESHINL